MTKQQLDLVTLTVSPEEARMIATALQMRSNTFSYLNGDKSITYVSEAEGNDVIGQNYMELRRKIDRQSGVGL
jgi:hypothetical protein